MNFLLIPGKARRSFAVFGFMVVCVVAGYLIAVSWKTPVHQFNLWKLNGNFHSTVLSHPPDSRQVLSFKKFGGLFSSAAHSCDYFVGEFRISTSSKEEVQEYYRDLYAGDYRPSVERLPVQIRFWDEEEFWIHYPWSELYAELLHIFDFEVFPSEQKGLHVVFVTQTVRPPFDDLRCGGLLST